MFRVESNVKIVLLIKDLLLFAFTSAVFFSNQLIFFDFKERILSANNQ